MVKILQQIYDGHIAIDQLHKKVAPNLVEEIEDYVNPTEKILFQCLNNQLLVLFNIVYKRYFRCVGVYAAFQRLGQNHPLVTRLFEVACVTGQYHIIKLVFDTVFITNQADYGLNNVISKGFFGCFNNTSVIKYLRNNIIPTAIVNSKFDPMVIDYMFAIYSSIINLFNPDRLRKIAIRISIALLEPLWIKSDWRLDPDMLAKQSTVVSHFLSFEWMPKYLQTYFSSVKEDTIQQIRYQYKLV